jgi:tetratricopeptide (TPR) repeat protein
LSVLKGDCKAYDQLCKELLERIGRTKESFSGQLAFLASRSAMLRPEAGTDPAEAVRWAVLAVTGEPKCPWYLNGLGLAHYRAGQLAEALRRCRESLDADPHWGGVVLNWLLLAMTEQRLGHTEEARRWLDKVVHWRQHPEGGSSPPDMPLSDFLEFQVLYPEAEALFLAETKN